MAAQAMPAKEKNHEHPRGEALEEGRADKGQAQQGHAQQDGPAPAQLGGDQGHGIIGHDAAAWATISVLAGAPPSMPQ